MLTFKQWLRKQAKRHDRVGDLARDVVLDAEWPRCRATTDPASVQKRCARYLTRMGACEGAHGSLTKAIEEYRTYRATVAPVKQSEETR